MEAKAPIVEVSVEADPPVLKLKDKNGHFTTESKICVMAIVGEQEVHAHRCGTVIQTVARHLFALDMCFVVSVNWLIAEHSVVVVRSCWSFTGHFDLC